ncbi:hypothetical protein HDE_01058 [Halotydeus destructor]|nr:hypothetical protein HDE_01058 [Halotydeus destructor]
MDITRFTFAPEIHVCPATDQVFNFTTYNAKFNTTLGNLTTDEDVFAFQSMMTIAQLLEYTPKANEFVGKCIIRRPHSNGFTYLNRTACNRVLNVTKYYTLEYICYVVNLIPYKDDIPYDANRIRYALNYPGMYYQVTLGDMWLKFMNYFKLLSTLRKNGDRSISGANVISRGFYNNTSLYDMFYVSFHKIRYQRLPPPFDTQCRDYFADGLKSSSDCAHKCINTRCMREMDRYWYASHARIPLEKYPLSSNDFKNKTYGKIFEDIFVACQRACAQPECTRTRTMTLVRSERYDDGITIKVVKTKEPSFFIKFDAFHTLESYLIFGMSCIGFWFGLSVLSFNPARFMKADKPCGFKSRKDGGFRSRVEDLEIRKDMKMLHRLMSQLKADIHLTNVTPTRYVTPPSRSMYTPHLNSPRDQVRIHMRDRSNFSPM